MTWYAVVVLCLTASQVTSDSSVCSQPAHQGTGTGSYGQYYYDASSNTCKKFTYSGVGGNGNHFNDVEECMRVCGGSGSSGGGFISGSNSQQDILYNILYSGNSDYGTNKPIDGGWTEWSVWSHCSVTCGSGYMTKTRACSSPGPQYGGHDCYGGTSESTSCNLGACHYPVDGYWTDWSDWSECSGSCEKDGIKNWKYKSRTCVAPSYGGADCVGYKKVKARCNTQPCSVDGGWGSWGSWAECSVTCGQGYMRKERRCDNPSPSYNGYTCTGDGYVTKYCQKYDCPVDGGWGQWTAWATCSATCGKGATSRSRSCNNPSPTYNGRTCEGISYETMYCHTNQYCPVDGGWGGWSSWSDCSKTCGGGVMRMTRSCGYPKPNYGGKPCYGDSVITKSCNTNYCAVDGGWGHWGSWSDCSKTCGGGIMRMRRRCDNPVPDYGGNSCYGDSIITKSCNTQYCSVDGGWGTWGSWSDCSKPCGGGVMRMRRTCNNPSPNYGGHNCYGDAIITKSCNNHYCSVDGGWGNWGSWSDCSATCGGGIMRMRRSCDNPVPDYGGHSCYGDSEITKACNTHYCSVDGGWGSWGSWSDCSKTCGGGVMRMRRTCNNPSPNYGGHNCYGDAIITKSCNNHYCSVDGGWSSWHSWSNCDKTCGGGKRTRSRKCDNPSPSYGGHDCGSYTVVTEDCNTQPCPPDVTCPGGGAPLQEYGSIVYCGKNSYNPTCPYGYTCYSSSSYTYGSSGHTFSVCCPYQDSFVCDLPVDPGHCSVSSALFYYYNKATDSCELFYYGGCGGNWNRFRDLQECEKKCVQKPKTKDCCLQPKDSGSTTGSYCYNEYNEWYYNSETNKCEPFTYTGCGGNTNRFHDKLICENLCQRQYDTSYNGDKCNQPRDPGYGPYNALMFYYNKDTDTCEKLRYKGAGGNDNLFYDYWECEEACRKEPTSISVCSQPLDHGTGSASYDEWYYNTATQSCDSCVYSGQGGNLNRFHDADSCIKVCKNSVPTGSVCDLPKHTGDGYESHDRYYYDQQTGQCDSFTYTGHGGNDNCFKSKKICEDHTQICKKPYVSVAACELLPDSGYGDGALKDDYWFYNKETNQCEEFRFFGYGGNDNRFSTKENCEKHCVNKKQTSDVCDLPGESGPCRGNYQMFFYDSYSKKCLQFTYGGCLGNDNRFLTKEECEGVCGSYTTPAASVCDLNYDSGTGPGYYAYFYYNKATNRCEQFYYYGYEGNGNRFVDYHTCYNTCVKTDVNDCDLPLDQGTGNNWVWSYYYNKDYKQCQQFVYNGSGGNNNRFPDKLTCEKACGGKTGDY